MKCPSCGYSPPFRVALPLHGLDYVRTGECGLQSPSGYYRCTRTIGHRGAHSVLEPVIGTGHTWPVKRAR